VLATDKVTDDAKVIVFGPADQPWIVY
jgi:hypothetical protein